MARHFANWLREYMAWTSISEAPDAFHFWTGVGTIAGALRSCVWIDQKIYMYTPNFFIFFVAPPGIATKSTSIGLGMRLLEQVPGITFGPASTTWQKLAKEMEAAVITVKWKDSAGVEHQRAASPITVEASELGSFLKMGQEGLTDILIDLWDGKIKNRAWTHGTLTGGTTAIKNPWIHVLGATTPSWLSQNFPEHMINGGLTSRILFVYGETKRQLVAYPAMLAPGIGYDQIERKLVEDLIEISNLRGPFTLTPEALDYGKTWYETLWTSVPLHMASVRFEGYRARKQAMLHKIAMVLSAATREDLVIDKAELIEADAHLTSTEASMMRVFDSIGVVDEARWVKEIVNIVRTYSAQFPKGMPSNDVYAQVANIITVKDFETALLAAVQRGLLERILHSVDASTGKRTYAVRVPIIHTTSTTGATT